MQFLLLIESNTTGTGRRFAQATRKLGVCPILIASDPTRYQYVSEDAIDVLTTDTANWHELESAVSKFARSNPVLGIYSSSEYWIEASARLALKLGLPGAAPEAVSICRNKRKQRNYFKTCSLPTPLFRCITSLSEVNQALVELSFPIVVKPTEGSGSIGVRLCDIPQQALTQAQLLLSQRVNERNLPVPQEVLFEEYLKGDEYSAEMFHGEIIGITRKHLSKAPYFVEIGHDFPAEAPDTVINAIRESVRRALSVVGLTWGPVHIELRVTDRGPVVIEMNPRLAGGFIPELVRLSSGIDLIEHTILAVIGESSKACGRQAKYASIRFLIPKKEGMLRAIYGVKEAASLEAVAEVELYKKPGDPILLCGDFRDRIGHVIACHESAQTAMISVQRANETLRVELQ